MLIYINFSAYQVRVCLLWKESMLEILKIILTKPMKTTKKDFNRGVSRICKKNVDVILDKILFPMKIWYLKGNDKLWLQFVLKANFGSALKFFTSSLWKETTSST